jgi:hypothetical protein
MSYKNLGLPSVYTVTSVVPEVSSEPNPMDRTAEYVRRIADLEGRLNSLKWQTTTAMGQAEKICCIVPKSISARRSSVCFDGKNCSSRRMRSLYDRGH